MPALKTVTKRILIYPFIVLICTSAGCMSKTINYDKLTWRNKYKSIETIWKPLGRDILIQGSYHIAYPENNRHTTEGICTGFVTIGHKLWSTSFTATFDSYEVENTVTNEKINIENGMLIVLNPDFEIIKTIENFDGIPLTTRNKNALKEAHEIYQKNLAAAKNNE